MNMEIELRGKEGGKDEGASLDFLMEPREVTCGWHLRQAYRWLRYDRGRELDNVLVYASFELRAAIERSLLECLLLITGGKLSEKELSACRKPGGVCGLIGKYEPAYRKRVQFSQIVISLDPKLPNVVFLDLRLLRKRWSELSEFCHKQNEPSQTFSSPDRSFQKRGFKLIRETLNELTDENWESNRGLINPDGMEPEVREIYEKFADDRLDADQVRRMLTIMEPALKQRLNPRILRS